MKTFISFLLVGLIYSNNYTLSAQNAPISSIGVVETYNDTMIVPITVAGFIDIGGCDLLFNYDSTVATATSVSLGPGVGYFMFVPDIETPGIISLSWLFFEYGTPGLTLPDNSVFLNITFERAGYGYSAFEFDNSLPDNCLFTDWNFDELNDIPNSTYYIDGSIAFEMIDAPITSVPELETCQGSESIDIPVTVSGFDQIGAFNLTMQYDASVFSYQSFTNDSGFPDLVVYENSPGTIIAEGLSDDPAGFILANNSTLFTVHFDNQGGSTALTWLDNGESCQYQRPAPAYEPMNDSPQSSYYINGAFIELPFPAPAGTISGPPGGVVCQGATEVVFSVPPIAFTNTYEWTLPFGASIESGENTQEVIVSFSDNAVSGDINVYGINDCGDGIASPSYPLIVETVPATASTIIGPAGGSVCQEETGVIFSVSPIAYADSYAWALPEGAFITNGENTQEITVSFSDAAVSGDISVYGINDCGDGMVSPPFPLIVDVAPSINVQPVSPDTVYAGNGTALFVVTATGSNLSFQWQEYTDNWDDISDGGVYAGALTSLLTITDPPVSMNGNNYRCIVSGSCEPSAITDGNAVLTVVIYTGLDNNFESNNGNGELKFKSFPNPFSEQITFTYVPPSKGTVTIGITNIYGEKLAVLTDHAEGSGDYLLHFDAKHLRPGIYVAAITFKNDNRIITNILKIISDK